MRSRRIRSAILLCAILVACGPFGPVPGGRLEGTVSVETPALSSSCEDAVTVQLEVRPSDPYSVNLWCVTVEGGVYVAAGRGGHSAWARAMLEDASVRLRIGTDLYSLNATRISSQDEILAYMDSLASKYEVSQARLADFQPTSGVSAEAILFRLDDVR